MRHITREKITAPIEDPGKPIGAVAMRGLLAVSTAVAGLAMVSHVNAATVKWEPAYQEPVPPDDPNDADSDPDGTTANPLIKQGNWWDGQGTDPGDHAYWGTTKLAGNQAWTQGNWADFPNYYFDGVLHNKLNVVGDVQVGRIFASGVNTHVYISSTSGGTLTLGADGINSTGGPLQIDVPLTLGAASVPFFGLNHRINGVVSGTSSQTFLKTAGSAHHVTELNAVNAYTGETRIESGILRLGASGDISSSSGVTVLGTATFDADANSNATVKALKGDGKVSAHSNGLVVSELLSPGASAGTLTFSAGSLTLGDGAIYDFEIDGDTANPVSDLVVLPGTVNFDGDWTLKLSNLGTVDPAGLSFVLFEYGGVDPTTLGNYSIDYGSTGWSGGAINVDSVNNEVVLTLGNPVPEPASLSLLVLGAAGLLGRRRRNRA